jgi:hypothetical protein
MAKANHYQFRGVASPNTTQVPDQYFDELLSICSGAEIKALMYITRRTMGFKRPSDTISISQLLHGITTRGGRVLDRGTGLSKPTLLKALRNLIGMGVIIAEHRSSRERGDEPTSYSLHFIDSAEVRSRTVAKKVAHGGGKETSPGGWARKLTTQHTGGQQTEEQHTVSSKFNISKGETAPLDPADFVENTRESRAPVAILDRPRLTRSERIEVVIEELSEDFDDSTHRRANCTQALRLFHRSGLSEDAFESRLYEARSITRDEMNRRRLTGTGAPVNNRMAYFFGVLRHELGMTDAEPAISTASRAEVQR